MDSVINSIFCYGFHDTNINYIIINNDEITIYFDGGLYCLDNNRNEDKLIPKKYDDRRLVSLITIRLFLVLLCFNLTYQSAAFLVSALLCFGTLLYNPYFKANKCINLKIIIIDQMFKFGLFFSF